MKIGIVGVSGYGGGELLRLCAGHPSFELAYVGGESTAGQTLAERFPALGGHPAGELVIEPFVPEEVAGVDLLFASLPTGKSAEPLSRVPRATKIVDIGGDHRFVPGWTYGLTELPGQRGKIRGAARLANPGCYPAAALLALAPLVQEGLVEPEGIVIDAKSGVTGTGRGGSSDYGYCRDQRGRVRLRAGVAPPRARDRAGAGAARRTPGEHRLHAAPRADDARHPRHLLRAAEGPGERAAALRGGAGQLPRRALHARAAGREGRSAHTGWATGSNLAFLSYAVNARTGLVVAIGAIDNLGKGAAAQAVQNANLMTGPPETAGLTGLPLWP